MPPRCFACTLAYSLAAERGSLVRHVAEALRAAAGQPAHRPTPAQDFHGQDALRSPSHSVPSDDGGLIERVASGIAGAVGLRALSVMGSSLPTVGRDPSCGYVLIVLPPRVSLSRPSCSGASLPRERPEQAGLADILDGEHANELSVLRDRQRPEATLLQDGKSILEQVSLRRDRGDVRLHQLTHARVPLWGVGCGHDLLTRDHAHQLPVLV